MIPWHSRAPAPRAPLSFLPLWQGRGTPGTQEGAAEVAGCPTLPSPPGSGVSLPAMALGPLLAITTLSPLSPARHKT